MSADSPAQAAPSCFLDKLPPDRRQWILSQMNMGAFVEPMRRLRRELEAASQPITEIEVPVHAGSNSTQRGV